MLTTRSQSIIVFAFLLLVRKIYLSRHSDQDKMYKRIQEMDTRPTLLLCPASMISGWIQKFEENLEGDHPLQIHL